MTLASGDRVYFLSPGVKPLYLNGRCATVIRKQPGEPRYLVLIDNDPRARRFAGGTWCVHEDTIVPLEDELTPIDEKAKAAARTWLAAIAPRIEEESTKWANETLDTDEEHERYFDVDHPALLWRFYFHLSALMKEAGEGWETVYHQAKGSDAREVEGS